MVDMISKFDNIQNLMHALETNTTICVEQIKNLRAEVEKLKKISPTHSTEKKESNSKSTTISVKSNDISNEGSKNKYFDSWFGFFHKKKNQKILDQKMLDQKIPPIVTGTKLLSEKVTEHVTNTNVLPTDEKKQTKVLLMTKKPKSLVKTRLTARRTRSAKKRIRFLL